jgi:hypothetical protein
MVSGRAWTSKRTGRFHHSCKRLAVRSWKRACAPLRWSARTDLSSTIATSSSQPAVASVCTARKSTFPLCWLAKSSESRKSTRAFGLSDSCTTISDISTCSREPCNPSTTRSARGCHLCLRYVPLPMSPGRTGVRDVADPRLEPPTLKGWSPPLDDIGVQHT